MPSTFNRAPFVSNVGIWEREAARWGGNLGHPSNCDATRQLRQTYDAEELPIVALTAAALVSERDEALAAGMNDFLTKPLDERRLQQALARHLGSARDHLPSTL